MYFDIIPSNITLATKENCIPVPSAKTEGSSDIIILSPHERLMNMVRDAQSSVQHGIPFLPTLDLLRIANPVARSSGWWHASSSIEEGGKKLVVGWYGKEGNENELSIGFVLDRSQSGDTPGVHLLEFSKLKRTRHTIRQSDPNLFLGNVPCTDRDEVVRIPGGKNIVYQEMDFQDLLQTPIITQIRVISREKIQKQKNHHIKKTTNYKK